MCSYLFLKFCYAIISPVHFLSSPQLEKAFCLKKQMNMQPRPINIRDLDPENKKFYFRPNKLFQHVYPHF